MSFQLRTSQGLIGIAAALVMIGAFCYGERNTRFVGRALIMTSATNLVFRSP